MSLAGQSRRSCIETRPRCHYHCRHGHGEDTHFLDTASRPLLFFPAGHIQVVITPLNLLGKQNVELLEKAGIKAISIGADMTTSENFLVSQPL